MFSLGKSRESSREPRLTVHILIPDPHLEYFQFRYPLMYSALALQKVAFMFKHFANQIYMVEMF